MSATSNGLTDSLGRRVCRECRKPQITCTCWPSQGFGLYVRSWDAMQDLLDKTAREAAKAALEGITTNKETDRE